MNTKLHNMLLKQLMTMNCQIEEDITFVYNVADWCKSEGISEPDRNRPLRLVLHGGTGCRLIVREEVPARVIEEHINAMRMRMKLQDTVHDYGDRLDSDRKKLAYIFLSEYAMLLPNVKNERDADEWAFKEMEAMGLFKEAPD